MSRSTRCSSTSGCRGWTGSTSRGCWPASGDPGKMVFVTAYEEHAVDAFDLRAVDYLLKPVREQRLAEAVRRVRDSMAAPTPGEPAADETIAVELGGVTRFINRSDVRFAEAHGDYARLHTADGSHLVRVPLTTLEEQWSAAGFVRIHRRYLVALAHIDEVAFDSGHGTVRVGDDELSVSRRHLRVSPSSGPRTVSSLTIEEGRVEFVGPGGSIAIGANPAGVNRGDTLEIRNQSVISTSPGHVLTLNGGTLRNSNPGFAAATYPGMGTQIQLTSNGGTFDIPAGGFGGYNLMSYSGVVGMSPGTTSATLNKTGPGEFRPLTGWTFTGLNVEQGLYRIGNPSGSETGFGAPTGTVTVAGGASRIQPTVRHLAPTSASSTPTLPRRRAVLC